MSVLHFALNSARGGIWISVGCGVVVAGVLADILGNTTHSLPLAVESGVLGLAILATLAYVIASARRTKRGRHAVKVVLVPLSILAYVSLPQIYLITLTTLVRPTWVRIAIIAGGSSVIYLVGLQRLYLHRRRRRHTAHVVAKNPERRLQRS